MTDIHQISGKISWPSRFPDQLFSFSLLVSLVIKCAEEDNSGPTEEPRLSLPVFDSFVPASLLPAEERAAAAAREERRGAPVHGQAHQRHRVPGRR